MELSEEGYIIKYQNSISLHNIKGTNVLLLMVAGLLHSTSSMQVCHEQSIFIIRCIESILKSRYSKHMVKIREKVNAVVLHPRGWGVMHGGRHCFSVSI